MRLDTYNRRSSVEKKPASSVCQCAGCDGNRAPRPFWLARVDADQRGPGARAAEIVGHLQPAPAVAVVPVEPDGSVVLIRHYRHAVAETLLEIPAGKLDEEGEFVVGGRRVKTIDVHAHCVVPKALELMGRTPSANEMRGPGITEVGLRRIRDIRASEKRFYQKVRDLFKAASVDYDGTELDYLSTRKGLAPQQVSEMFEHVAAQAKGEGLDYRFDKVVVITAPAKLREQRRRVTRDDRDVYDPAAFVGDSIFSNESWTRAQVIGHQLGGDGDSAHILAVLAGITVIWQYGDHFVCRGPFRRIDHEQQLH